MITAAFVGLAFVFGVGTVLAVASLFRDFGSRRYNYVEHRLRLDADESDIEDFYRSQDVHTGKIDQWFYRVVRESGVGLDVSTALSLCFGVGLIGAAFAYVISENFLATALGLAFGLLIPLVWITYQRWRRVAVMREQLPEALQIVADSVRAGHSLEHASEMAADELNSPISEEFDECASQLRLGNSPVAVMNRMAENIPLPEFRVFATAAMVHQTAGGNLPLLTERLAHAARQRQEFSGHVNAVTAGSRLSAFGLVLASAIAIGALAWLEPDYVSAFINHPLGPSLLTLAIVLQIIGMVWVWRVIRVSY